MYFSYEIFHILAEYACCVCADVTAGLCLAECVSGNVFVEYASCLYAAEFVWLRAGVAHCVSSLLT